MVLLQQPGSLRVVLFRPCLLFYQQFVLKDFSFPFDEFFELSYESFQTLFVVFVETLQ